MEISEKTPFALGMNKDSLPLQIQKKLEKTACKNPVYESLLSEYTSLRKEELTKIANATAKIDSAKEQIEKDKPLLEAAAAKADMDSYEKIKADIIKNEEVVKLFEGFLSDLKRNSAVDPETAKRLYSKADEEIAVIKEQFNKEFTEALNPLIELSNKTFLQMQLLELAKGRIKANLERGQSNFAHIPFLELRLMGEFDRIMQNDDYKKCNPNYAKDPRTNTHKWTSPAEEIIKKESAKWI